MHTITAFIRALPALAGIPNPPEISISLCNDTGSTSQSLHLADLQAIGLDPVYPLFGEFCGWMTSQLAQGCTAQAPKFILEMRVMGAQGVQVTPLTGWFTILAVLDIFGGARLSGDEKSALFCHSQGEHNAIWRADKDCSL